jgi:hypothetical protein
VNRPPYNLSAADKRRFIPQIITARDTLALITSSARLRYEPFDHDKALARIDRAIADLREARAGLVDVWHGPTEVTQ